MFFFSRLPRSRLGGLAFAVLTSFPPGWNGGFHLWRYSGGASRSTASTGGFSPIQVPWVPVYLVSWALSWSYCLRHVQVVAATATPPVLHTLRQPGFPRKLRLRGCRRWLRLRILSGRSPLGRSLCSVSSSASSPSTLVASWCGARELASHFFPFPFPLGVLVTPGLMDRELVGIFPSGCFLFQLWGCPASALAVVGKGGSVLRAHPFFGTVACCLFKTLLFPSYATRCRYDVPGVLASGSGFAASACSCACGRCLRIALGHGAGFPFVSLPCGRVV